MVVVLLTELAANVDAPVMTGGVLVAVATGLVMVLTVTLPAPMHRHRPVVRALPLFGVEVVVDVAEDGPGRLLGLTKVTQVSRVNGVGHRVRQVPTIIRQNVLLPCSRTVAPVITLQVVNFHRHAPLVVFPSVIKIQD